MLASPVLSCLAEEEGMEMFLMVLCMSLLGVGVSAALFAAATADERRREVPPLDQRLVAETPQRFFAVVPPVVPPIDVVPIDVLLLRLEQHIRLEQAAAESFHQFPTPESLHVRTVSPLVH
jgi:hypothetical protein